MVGEGAGETWSDRGGNFNEALGDYKSAVMAEESGEMLGPLAEAMEESSPQW
jgi:hypothetical protein